MSIVLKNICVSFGQRTVLNNISANFAEGTLTAIMGPSGAGKSTLLGVVAGSEPPGAGAQICVPEHVEWLVQTTPLFLRRSALDNVISSALFRGVPRDTAIRRGLRALRAVDILPLARLRTHRLSGGEKQRVAIARAMTARAAVLLADEPTAALDAASRDRVCSALVAAARAGATVLIATHDPVVAATCDATLSLAHGVLDRGSPA